MWFKWRRSRQRRGIIGLDIGPSIIKLVLLKSHENRHKVMGLASILTPEGAVQNGNISESEAVGQALRSLFRAPRIGQYPTGIALADSAVRTQLLSVAAELHGIDLEARLLVDVAKHIPYSLQEVTVDFEPTKRGQSLTKEVLLSVAPIHRVSPFQQVIEAVGSSLKIVDVESHAIARACSLCHFPSRKTDLQQIQAIVDINLERVLLVILQDKLPIFTHAEALRGALSLPIECKPVKCFKSGQEMAQTFQVHLQKMEQAMLCDFALSISHYLRRTLGILRYLNHSFQIQTILLSGDYACWPEFVDILEGYLRIEVQVANPFVGMQFENNAVRDTAMSVGPAFVLSCGLSMRGVL